MSEKIVITTDSTADLGKRELDKYNIKVVPLHVTFGDKDYKDSVDIDTNKLYELVDEYNSLPKTQAVSPGEFVNFFKPLLDEGNKIVHISIGSTISGSYQSAVIAKDMLETDDIYVIDSKNLSSGIGLLVLKASRFKEDGLSAKIIYEKVNDLVPKVSSQFVIRTMEYLHKGGRATGLQAFVGSILNIKPIIKVNDGILDVYQKSIGKMTRALDIMINDLIALKDKIDLEFVYITHSLADKSFDYMKEKILKEINPKHLIEGNAGCVISSHCGKGTIGVLYILK